MSAAQADGVPQATPEMMRRYRETQARRASYVPVPGVPNRTALDGLHHKVVSAAVELGVVVALKDEAAKPTAIARLNEAEQAYFSAMDVALPVGGEATT